jgi:hypothetical protein
MNYSVEESLLYEGAFTVARSASRTKRSTSTMGPVMVATTRTRRYGALHPNVIGLCWFNLVAGGLTTTRRTLWSQLRPSFGNHSTGKVTSSRMRGKRNKAKETPEISRRPSAKWYELFYLRAHTSPPALCARGLRILQYFAGFCRGSCCIC